LKHLNANRSEGSPVAAEPPRRQKTFRRPGPAHESGLTADLLPDGEALRRLTGVIDSAAVEAILRCALVDPVREMTDNGGKRIRGQLVTLAFRLLAHPADYSPAVRRRCGTCAQVIELVHAGSLIIDDIEDGSVTRRGGPALHVRYGVPLALNAGNWLYFLPLQLLNDLGLPDGDMLRIYRYYHQTLLKAHFGQALDLGARVDVLPQNQIEEICLASLKLKTGALMGLAVALGAWLAGASEKVLSILYGFGTDLGVALQMFDDIGNLTVNAEPDKRYEDVLLFRASWVWACASRLASAREFAQFIAAARDLPQPDKLELWVERHGLLEYAREAAGSRLTSAYEMLGEELEREDVRYSREVFRELWDLGRRISVAYG
jgi:geranylgeranyl pyrophosphate synthase